MIYSQISPVLLCNFTFAVQVFPDRFLGLIPVTKRRTLIGKTTVTSEEKRLAVISSLGLHI